MKKKEAVIAAVDLYTAYARWCRDNHLRPVASQAFSRIAQDQIELGHGVKYRHDLLSEDRKARREWKGLKLLDRDDGGQMALLSRKSATVTAQESQTGEAA